METYNGIKYDGLNFSTMEVNRNFKIKVSGESNGQKVHKLVGVYGLLELIGTDLTNTFIEKAFNKGLDKVECKLRRGLKVTFYTV
ncbi:ribosomal large subunit pseudouridine synthase B [Dysgonomonas capnocytophagoides]|uniref:Ribosomal large subunit pseudouridine synthase B n=1 Tax=Dysgonomonas capnocytophagoides TaxID=45254 RepID=A0A4Y8KYC0_9BACT|nr:ribosomal large subunit pseudouridine synthase B [Dysgonomonas capnocytophagoides]TFD94649.1 ribosomal large subunit pseudouridine synthase B [Dysgonomonas capnocytophagoides]